MNNTVYKNVGTLASIDTVTTVLNGWDGWEAVLDDVSVTFGGSTYNCMLFFPDAGRSCAIAIPSSSPFVAKLFICSVTESGGTVTATVIQDKNINTTVQSGYDTILRVMQNNTALCISYYVEVAETGEMYFNPDIVFVAKTVSPATGAMGSSVIGYTSYTNDTTTSYQLCSSLDTNPVVMSYDIKAEAAYTTLLPLIGSTAGVAAGIYYPLMTESATKNYKIIHMNDKTFYRVGNICMIDYYTG